MGQFNNQLKMYRSAMPDDKKKKKNINNKLANEFESRERHRISSQGNVFGELSRGRKESEPKMMLEKIMLKKKTEHRTRPLSEPNDERVRSHEYISALDKKYRPKGDANVSKNVLTNIKTSSEGKGYRKGPLITGNPSDLEKEKLKVKNNPKKVNKILGY